MNFILKVWMNWISNNISHVWKKMATLKKILSWEPSYFLHVTSFSISLLRIFPCTFWQNFTRSLPFFLLGYDRCIQARLYPCSRSRITGRISSERRSSKFNSSTDILYNLFYFPLISIITFHSHSFLNKHIHFFIIFCSIKCHSIMLWDYFFKRFSSILAIFSIQKM